MKKFKLVLNELLLAPLIVGTTDFSAFPQISYYSVLLAAQTDAFKKYLVQEILEIIQD